jgi:hypothetical protein
VLHPKCSKWVRFIKFSFFFKFTLIFSYHRFQKIKVCSCKFWHTLIILFRSREAFIDPPHAATRQSSSIPTPVSYEDTLNSSRETPKSRPSTPPIINRISVTPEE